MDKKIFFFDIDGTLAQRNIMPDDTKVALRKLKKAGHYVFICTGRPYAMQNIILENMWMDLFVQMEGIL